MANLFTDRIPGLVSIVVTVYNREQYISDTLDNIKKQTYKNIEVVVANDCSTDSSESVVMEWRRNNQDAFINFVYVKLPRNRNEEWASNIAFCLTSGEFITLQHSDDLCHVKKLERQVEILRKHPETACVGTNYMSFEDRE